jgi:hypothetical protein
MAVHSGPASLRPRCTRGGSSVAAIPFYYPPIYRSALMRRTPVVNAGDSNGYTFLVFIKENATGRYLTFTYASSLPRTTLLLYPTSKPRHCTYFGKEGLSVNGLQIRAIYLCHLYNQVDLPVGYSERIFIQ